MGMWGEYMRHTHVRASKVKNAILQVKQGYMHPKGPKYQPERKIFKNKLCEPPRGHFELFESRRNSYESFRNLENKAGKNLMLKIFVCGFLGPLFEKNSKVAKNGHFFFSKFPNFKVFQKNKFPIVLYESEICYKPILCLSKARFMGMQVEYIRHTHARSSRIK